MKGTEHFLSHIQCITENETLKFPFIFTEKQRCKMSGAWASSYPENVGIKIIFLMILFSTSLIHSLLFQLCQTLNFFFFPFRELAFAAHGLVYQRKRYLLESWVE